MLTLLNVICPFLLSIQDGNITKVSPPPVTIASLGLSPPISELVPRLERWSRAYRFRVVEFGSIDPPSMPRTFQDGIVLLHGGGGALTIEQILLARDKESEALCPRRKVDHFALVRGETSSSLTQLGSLRPSIILYCPSPLPTWFYYLQGLTEPQHSGARLKADNEVRPGCREATFISTNGDTIRITYSLEAGTHIRRLDVIHKDGVVETVVYLGAVHDVSLDADIPETVLRTVRKGDEPRLLELWSSIEVNRTRASSCEIPSDAEILDLRVPGESASSLFTDRATTVSALLDWNTDTERPDASPSPKKSIECSLDRAPSSGSPVSVMPSIEAPPRTLDTERMLASTGNVVLLSDVHYKLTDSEMRLLRLAGVQMSEASKKLDNPSQHIHAFTGEFCIPGFFRAPVGIVLSAVQPQFLFEPIGGQAERVDRTDECRGCGGRLTSVDQSVHPYYSWLQMHLPPPVKASEAVLQVRQDGDTNAGSATVTLQARATSNRPLEIVAFRAGCGVQLQETLPVLLANEPKRLHFTCDLSRPYPLNTKAVVQFGVEGGMSLTLPLDIHVPIPRVVTSPAQLTFAETQPPVVKLSIETPNLRMRAIELIKMPLCVEVSAMHTYANRVDLQVVETTLAQRRHHCGSILGLVQFVGSEHPETIRLSIRHERPLRDEAGSVALYGVFLAGEEIVLYQRTSGEIVIACPDRVPCGPDMLARAGLIRLASMKVPADAEKVDWSARDSGERAIGIRVHGRTSGKLNECVALWNQICN